MQVWSVLYSFTPTITPRFFSKIFRKCQKESHIPLRCEEAQEDVDFETKKRKFIEERMSEAVIRKCPTCGKK